MAPEYTRGLNLPVFINSPADVMRLRREVSVLDEYLRQESLRHADQSPSQLPAMSRLLEELTTANNVNLLDPTVRQQLLDFLVNLQTNAPVIYISFAVDPSPAFMQKIVQWFRQNIHPAVLVRVGLQPNIAAGCILRTTNRYYDCSLRERLKRSRTALVEALAAPPAVSTS